jgi:anti-sigma regulatory factor (Ser/Thr protein kinase)
MTVSTHVEASGFSYAALFYRSHQEYLDELVPFIVDGVQREEPTFVTVPGDNLALLRDALGDTTKHITMANATDAFRNPGRLLALQNDWVATHPDKRVRLVGEMVWSGRNGDDYPACVEHEALVNMAFDGRDVSGLCPYDISRLDQEILADARTTHPLVWKAGAVQPCAEYAPDDTLARYNQPLPHSNVAARYTIGKYGDLSAARSFVGRYAYWLGLSHEGIGDLQLITTELATNSLEHTDGECRLALWKRDGHLVCEVADSGRLNDPLVGRRPPPAGQGGRGLFVVNAVADLVRRHATEDGTTIQAYLRLDPSESVTA